ncbi:hypothetical protein [Wukongibacter sp. M2B1]|uniref:hypothetical protein n=1 Tax=Wukongibacter sp. M2B1 TaxID=3088895 RepID=UPI003D7BBF44
MKNIKVNNINTLAFLTEEERELYNQLCEEYTKLGNIKRYCYQIILNDEFKLTYVEHEEKLKLNKYYKKECTEYIKKKVTKEQIKKFEQLREEFDWKSILESTDKIKKDVNKIIRNRKLNDTCKLSVELNEYRQVYVSSSELTRNVDNDDIFIVSLHNKHIKTTRIWEQLVKKGFTFVDKKGNEKKVVFYTSSSGQIRKKKGFFVVEDSLNKVINRLNCGLTLEEINKLGGCNVNKYMAYSALNTSSTEVWNRFNIEKAIVVDDFETEIEVEVDYIDNITFYIIRRKEKVVIPHTDGCGMMLPSVSRKNLMIRLPWLKGLLTVVNFRKWNKEFGVRATIKDIDGNEHNINDVEVIFSRSQFKMWKYYSNTLDNDGNILEYGWDKYKRLFKEHGCTANITNVEPNKADFKDATLNYQMLQTLTDVKDNEIKQLLGKDLNYINNLYKDSNLQLEELTSRKDVLGKILKKYHNFLLDEHVQNELSNRISKRRKELYRAEFSVNKAKYTFILPDIIAWMQYLFTDNKNPEGVLKANEVHYSMFEYDTEVDVLRSPHLYKCEHCIRKNVEIDENYREYFKIGNSRNLGVYTSVKDDISIRLMFDVDGDKALIVQDDYFNNIVKRNVKDTKPLHYKLGKAPAQRLSNVAFYRGLKSAFRYNNVGKYSNYMTAEWNTTADNDTLRVLTALNNLSIDASKTLYFCYPEKDSKIFNKVEEAKKQKMPYFFKYIKDGYSKKELIKEKTTMNNLVFYLEEEFKNVNGKRYAENNLDKFNYKQFLNNKSILSKKNLTEEKQKIYQDNYRYFKKIKKEVERKIYETERDSDDFSLVRNVYYDYREKLKDYARDKKMNWYEFVDSVIAMQYKKNKASKNKGILLELFAKEILKNLDKNSR